MNEIVDFKRKTNINIPNEYVKFLKMFGGGEGIIGKNSYVILWSISELPDMNMLYKVKEYAPGFFIFGSDGGGEAYAFDTRTPAMPINSIPFVGMEPSLARMIASSFNTFLEVLYIA